MKIRMGVLVLGAVALGCDNRPDIVPVIPPGMEYHRTAELPDNESAEALGEPGRLGAEASHKVPLTTAITPPTEPGKTATTQTGIKYTTITPGTGPEARPGMLVTVHYTVTHADGTRLDSSRERDEPYGFLLGDHRVIPGWDEGISGMRVGERRQLIVPSEMAYGPSGRPPMIKPNETLHFDVELLKVEEAPKDLTQPPAASPAPAKT